MKEIIKILLVILSLSTAYSKEWVIKLPLNKVRLLSNSGLKHPSWFVYKYKVKNMVKPGGIIGLNDYLIYDGIIEDVPYGTYQSVNEFLFFNKNWSVDAIALHSLGFYDIYLRSPIE
jgi:hypothetical protein